MKPTYREAAGAVDPSRPELLTPETILCEPFDNSGHFLCRAGEDGEARWAVHKWTHPTSGNIGYFCPRHSPFDYHGPNPIVTPDQARIRARELWADVRAVERSGRHAGFWVYTTETGMTDPHFLRDDGTAWT